MVISKIFQILGLIVLSSGCAHVTEVPRQSRPVVWVLNTGLCEPETIIHDNAGDRLIVSNICGFSKNGKGYLSLLNMDGTLASPRWVDGLNAPAGMAIYGRKLYVVDIDRVHIIDLDQNDVAGLLGPFADVKAFNDIAIDVNETIYVSDSARHQIVKIKDGVAIPFPDKSVSFKFANGLYVDGKQLYVGGEKFWNIDLDTGDIKEVRINGLADIDGIETDGRAGLTVSIVGGDVWHLPNGEMPAIWTVPNLSSTNHAYLTQDDLVLVPTGYDNTIIAFRAAH